VVREGGREGGEGGGKGPVPVPMSATLGEGWSRGMEEVVGLQPAVEALQVDFGGFSVVGGKDIWIFGWMMV